MIVKIQFTDGAIEETDHSGFYETIHNKPVHRFAIGTADFYNHDYYSLESHRDFVLIKEWNDPKVWGEGHACEYYVYAPRKWYRKQYGKNLEQPFENFEMPNMMLTIGGIWVSDETARRLAEEWPIQKLPDYGKDGGF